MIPTLKNWYIVELSNNVAIGELHGHPDYPPGYHYQTKKVIHLDVVNNLLMDERENFTLGTPSPLWYNENKNKLQRYIV